MTHSMCISMTGRPTAYQIANEARRQSYSYYQIAKTAKEAETRKGERKSNDRT